MNLVFPCSWISMKKSAFKTLAGIAFITLLMLVAIELICIKILQEKYNRAFDSSIIEREKYFDTDGLKANATTTVWGKKFSTDSFGFRSTGKPFDKKKKTWLFIGDSVTQGVGVDDSCSFVSLLAAKTDSVNVLNCSMIGWNIHDYKNVIDFLLADSSNNLNIAHITIGWCLNDVYGKSKSTDLPSMGNKGWKRMLSDFLHQHYATFRLVKLYATQNSDNYFRYDEQFYRIGNEWYNQASETLSEMYDLCATKGICFDVAYFPYRSQLPETDTAFAPPMQRVNFDFFLSLEEHPCYDLLMPVCFFRDELAASTRKPIASKDLYLFSDEIHFSSLGHHIIATTFASNDFANGLKCFYDKEQLDNRRSK